MKESRVMKQQTKVCNKNIKLTLLLVLMEGCLLWLVVCLAQYIGNYLALGLEWNGNGFMLVG